MKIETRTINGVTVLDVSGKITLAEGSVDIRKSVRDLLDSGRNQILLNLGDVKYIDSSGIGELVSSFTSVTNKGGKLKLLNLTLKIRVLLAITKLLTVFECFDDEGEAVQSFS